MPLRIDVAKRRGANDQTENDADEKDRRRSARFNCGGDAKISLLPSDGIFLPGKILDLSLHGCRVDTTLPIDYGVRAEIVLRVNATSFRAVGEVRAIRGGCGAGIEFVQLSSSGKNMLADVIQELARLQAVMNKFKSGRLETDTKSFRRQLEEGRGQAEKLSKVFAAQKTVISPENATGSPEPNQVAAANQERIAETQPLVITVDIFG